MISPTLESAHQLKQRLIQNGRRGLALDIDDTLSVTRSYIIRKMQELFGNPENLTPAQVHDKYGWIHNVPYWKSEEITTWINDQWHSNDVQLALDLIEDCHEKVQAINRVKPIVAYVTARPESVSQGTQRWLDSHQFPSAELLLRPLSLSTEEGSGWKAEALSLLYPEIEGIVDDNSALIDELPADYAGTIYLFGHQSYKDSPLTIVPCLTWQDVLLAIQK